MPGRSFVGSSGYRYGFNGKENDNEVKNITGSQQDYGMRIYDPRLGRFLSVDPITSKYPELTPYQFASNRPIDGIDEDGLEYAKADGTSLGPVTDDYARNNGGVNVPEKKSTEPTFEETAKTNMKLWESKNPGIPYPKTPENTSSIKTTPPPADAQWAGTIGSGVVDGALLMAPEIGLARALPVISKVSQIAKTFDGVMVPSFTFGKTVYKYVPKGQKLYTFNKSGISFTTDLVTSNSVDAYTKLGLGFQITQGAGKGSINSLSTSYTVHQITMRGFYFSGKIAGQGPTIGGATQFVGMEGFTIFKNATQITKTTLGGVPKVKFGF